MITDLDKNKSGNIDFEEFLEMMRGIAQWWTKNNNKWSYEWVFKDQLVKMTCSLCGDETEDYVAKQERKNVSE